MTGQKHCCANCHFFQDSDLSGQGWCTHPKRQLSQNIKIVVRKQELACRNGWGDHLWTDPELAAQRTTDDILVASSTPAPHRLSEPATMPEDRLVARDRSPNTPAQLDQDDRTEVMRRGARDAILRARERHQERQGSATRPSPASETDVDIRTPIDDAGQPAGSRPAPRPSIIPSVPHTERSGDVRNPDDSIWDEVPAVTADIELPLLRNALRLPGQNEPGKPLAAAPNAPSRYDLALQKAQEYRVAKAKETADADDVVTSKIPTRETIARPAAPAAEPHVIDEVVRYEPQRGTDVDRPHAIDDVIETDESYPDEDYELDRSFRAEAPSRQSGHRWWKAFGRSRVFGHDQRDDRLTERAREETFDVPLAAAEDIGVESDPAPETRAPERHMHIAWDDRTLAPRSLPELEFASLDYLDDEASDVHDIRPFEVGQRAVMSPIAEHRVAPAHQPSEPERRGDRIPGTNRTLHRWTYHERPAHAPVTAPAAPPMIAEAEAAMAPSVEATTDHPQPETPTFDIDARQAPDFDIRRAIARQAEPMLDMTIEIAPDIPRECGTCRHFRASGNGDRGWCTNTWAFPHRPLVNADAVHCTSTIGCWWLPTDEDWDPKEYLEWLDQSTPRADRLIAALYGEEETRRYGN